MNFIPSDYILIQGIFQAGLNHDFISKAINLIVQKKRRLNVVESSAFTLSACFDVLGRKVRF